MCTYLIKAVIFFSFLLYSSIKMGKNELQGKACMCIYIWCLPGVTSGKEPARQRRRHKKCVFDPWVGKIPWRGGHGNLLQYSCLENPMDRGTWQATVHRVVKSRTRLKQLSIYIYIYICIHTHVYTYFCICMRMEYVCVCINKIYKTNYTCTHTYASIFTTVRIWLFNSLLRFYFKQILQIFPLDWNKSDPKHRTLPYHAHLPTASLGIQAEVHLGLIYVGHGRVDIISVCGQEASWAVGGCYPSMETWVRCPS